MVEAGLGVVEGQETEQSKPPQRRERSTISFPYVDLAEAEKVAQALHDHGGGSGDPPSLAAWMEHKSASSGGFRLKLAAARVFTLIEGGQHDLSLTPLGREIVDPKTQASARARAFLACPLYEAIFRTYEGALLPKDVGLGRQMNDVGVAPKQTATARQVMARSAEHAGFFAYGDDRLVRPAALALSSDAKEKAPAHELSTGGGGGDSTDGSVKVVTLGSGGQITLSVSVDLVALSLDDRAFIFKLIDDMRGYEENLLPKQLPPPTDSDEPATAQQRAE